MDILLYLLFHIQLILIVIGFHICQFAYLLKFMCNPQNQCSLRFHGHWRACAEWCEIWVNRRAGSARLSKAMLFLLGSAHTVNKSLSHSLFSATFLCFSSVISLFKWPPRTVLRCCLVFLSARRLGCASQKKYVLGKLIVIRLLAKSSMLMNQQYNYVSCL